MRELARVIYVMMGYMVSTVASGGRWDENVRTVVSLTKSIVQSSFSIGLPEGSAFPGDVRESEVVSCWLGGAFGADMKSQVRRKESRSRARWGK